MTNGIYRSPGGGASLPGTFPPDMQVAKDVASIYIYIFSFGSVWFNVVLKKVDFTIFLTLWNA